MAYAPVETLVAGGDRLPTLLTAAQHHALRTMKKSDDYEECEIDPQFNSEDSDGCSASEDWDDFSPQREDSEDDPGVHGVGLLQTIFNDIKNIVGEVMFGLAYALSMGTGIVPGLILTVAVAALLGYTSSMLGRAGAATTGEVNFTGICRWAKGPTFGKLVVIVVALKTTLTCTAFAIIVKESFAGVFRTLGVNGFFSNEVTVLLLFAVGIVLPLILMKDLSYISYFSVVGIAGELFALFVIVLRCADGSYQTGGTYFADLPLEKRPNFDDGVNVWGVSGATVILASNLALSFNGAHYNAPKYYNLLRDKSVRRWNLVTGVAFTVVIMMYFGAMLGGYLTFGSNVQAFLLLNYSDKDRLAFVARIGVGSGVLLALPLAFTACRDSYMQLFNCKHRRSSFYVFTFALFVPVVAVAAFVESIGPINSIGGAIFGSFITLIIPGLIAAFAGKKLFGSNALEHKFQWVVISLGVFLLCFGLYEALKKNGFI